MKLEEKGDQRVNQLFEVGDRKVQHIGEQNLGVRIALKK
jgi:hypothetical protein